MTKNTIWVTGAEGRLGSALVQLLSQDIDNKVIGTDKAEVDITDMDAVDAAMDVYHPTVVINCASMSDPDECEKNMVEAFKINTLGARNLAMATQRINAKIIQMSTDDVFEGKSGIRLTEFEFPTPKTVYGKSKLAGEGFVRELNPKHLIIRSSWVYGTGRDDFMTKVLDHAKKGESFEASTTHPARVPAPAVPSHSTSSSPTAMTSGLRKACSPARSPCRPCSKTS